MIVLPSRVRVVGWSSADQPPTSERDLFFLPTVGRVLRLVELLDAGRVRGRWGTGGGRARCPHAATRTTALDILTPLQELEVVHHHHQLGPLLSVLVDPLVQPQASLDEHLVS